MSIFARPIELFRRAWSRIAGGSNGHIQRAYQPGDPTWALAGANVGLNDRLLNPYQQHAYVFACVRAIATAVSSVPWRMYSGSSENARPIESGVLVDRFSRPNSLATDCYLWEATVSHLKCCGNALWVLKRDNAKQIPADIFVFSNEGWDCKADDKNQIEYYTLDMHDGRKPLQLTPEKVVHFRTWNPKSNVWGMSELDAARLSAEQDYMAALYNRSFFANSAIPGGIIEYPSGQMPLTDKQWEAIKTRWNAQFQGVNRAFKLAMLEGGAKYTPLSLPHRDMMFLQQRQWNREEILACFGVPPSKVGIFDAVQKAVQDSVERGFWNDTLIPCMRLIQSTLFAQFFLPLDGGRTWGKFDTSGVPVLQKNKGELITQAKQLFDMGMPLAKINAYLGMDLDLTDVEGADTGYLSVALVPVGVIGQEPAAPAIESAKAQRLLTAPRATVEMSATRDVLPHTPEQLAMAEAFVKALSPSERGMHESMRAYLQRVKKWLAEQMAKAETPADLTLDDLTLPVEWDKTLRSLAAKHYKAIAEVMKPIIEKHLRKAGIEFTVNLSDKRIVEFLRTKEIKVVGINENIRSAIREALVGAQESAATAPELQESVFGALQDTRARALRIARTETASAANGVEYNANVIAGVKSQLWIAARDENTRPSHLACMAQGAVPLGEEFVNGLRFPGDPNGGPEEVCNCRCSLMPAG